MKARASPLLSIVVLAAGFSSRLGRPKALARIRGTTLLRRTLAALAPFAASPIIVVAPPASARYRIGLPHTSVRFVANRRRAAGLSSSVQLGLRRARWTAAVLLVPVDLVELTRSDLRRLITRWRAMRRHLVARRLGAAAATPMILPSWLRGYAATLRGDEGLRAVARRVPPDLLTLVSMRSAAADVDTPLDLARARRRRLAAPQDRGVCTSR